MVCKAVAGLARVAPAAGRPEEAQRARQLIAQGLAALKQLAANSAVSLDARARLVTGLREIAGAFNALGERAQAEEAHRQSADLARQLVAEMPRETTYRWILGHCLRLTAFAARDQPGRAKVAEDALKEAEEVFARLAVEYPDNPEYAHFLGDTRYVLAEVQIGEHRFADAQSVLRRALETAEKASPEAKQSHESRMDLGHILWRAADVSGELHRPDEAERFQRRAVEVFGRLAADFPNKPYYRQEHGFSQWLVGWLMGRLNRPADAVEPFRTAAEIYAKLAVDYPDNADYRLRRSRSYYELAETLFPLGKHAGLADAAIQFPRIYPDDAEEYRRALDYLGRCATLAAKDASLSAEARKEAIANYGKQASGVASEFLKRGINGPEKANEMAWRLVAGPEPDFREPALAVQLARRAVEQAPKNGEIWNTLGVAHYRAGDCQAADKALRRSLELRGGGDSADWYFLAMIAWRQGEKDRARNWFQAARAYTAKYAPKNDEHLRFRAEAASLLGMPESDANELSDDLAIADATIAAEPTAWPLYSLRGRVRASTGDWKGAIADIARAFELGAEGVGPLRERALAYLGGSDTPGYRGTCAEMLKRYATTEEASTADSVAQTCTLAADAVTDFAPAIALAEKAVRSEPKSARYAETLGAILYRSGKFQQAAENLEKADGLASNGKELDPSRIQTWFFLAMAHRRLGHHEESARWLEKARDATEKAVKARDAASTPLAWNQRLTLVMLRKEAESLATSSER
jgi:tetratricopeptide (TPR) repeat protein